MNVTMLERPDEGMGLDTSTDRKKHGANLVVQIRHKSSPNEVAFASSTSNFSKTLLLRLVVEQENVEIDPV